MYLNITGSQPAAGLAGPRYIALPTIITPRAVVRGMGVLMLRSRGVGARRRRGMGDTTCPSGYVIYGPTGTCTETPEYRLAATLQEYVQAAQEGQYGSPPPNIAQMTAMLTQEVSNICAESFIPCGGSASSLIQGPLAQYAAWLASYTPQAAAPPSVTAPAPSSPATPAAAAAGLPPTVTIQNLTSGSSSQFNIGDQWRLTITGPANPQVTGSSTQNGQSNPAAPFGSTDSSGRAVLTGSMSSDTVGNWSEQWFVGGQPAGSVSFTVAAPAAAPAPASSSSAPAPSSAAAPAPASVTTSGFDLSSLTGTAATVGGFAVPWWGLLAVGGVAIYALSGSGGKR